MMIPAMGGASVRSIGGIYLKAFYRGDAFADGSAGAPDANPLVNLQGNTAYNLEEDVSTKQPHAETVLGLKAFTFARAASQVSKVIGGSPNIAVIGDEIAMWIVRKKNSPVSGSEIFFEVGTSTINTGFLLFVDGGTPDNNRAQCQTASAGQKTVFYQSDDETDYHVQYGCLDSVGLHVRQDGGADTSVLGSFGGLANNLSGIAMANGLSGSIYADISVAQAVCLVNAPVDVREEMDAFINANRGVAA